MPPFLLCIHDVTPAYEHDIQLLIREITPLLGTRFSLGVVPNWHGQWSLEAHPTFCRMLKDSGAELLLHGYFHQRWRGYGLTSWLTNRADEMNGLNSTETKAILGSGQQLFSTVFGESARGFLAPGWQQGYLRHSLGTEMGFEYIMGYFALDFGMEPKLPLVTWTWDCGRWAWLGHIGHGLGEVRHLLTRGIPILAIHPQDLARGFWHNILRLIHKLLQNGYEPSTIAELRKRKC